MSRFQNPVSSEAIYFELTSNPGVGMQHRLYDLPVDPDRAEQARRTYAEALAGALEQLAREGRTVESRFGAGNRQYWYVSKGRWEGARDA